MLVTVTKTLRWEMGHRLMRYSGPCARLHGHSYTADIVMRSSKLDWSGFVLDFAHIKEAVGAFVDLVLDHRTLLWYQDPLASLMVKDPTRAFIDGEAILLSHNPTAENIARLLWNHARGCALKHEVELAEVCVRETATGVAAVTNVLDDEHNPVRLVKLDGTALST